MENPAGIYKDGDPSGSYRRRIVEEFAHDTDEDRADTEEWLRQERIRYFRERGDLDAIDACDEALLSLLPRGMEAEKRISLRLKLEALKRGSQKQRQDGKKDRDRLGDASTAVNSPYRCRYEFPGEPDFEVITKAKEDERVCKIVIESVGGQLQYSLYTRDTEEEGGWRRVERVPKELKDFYRMRTASALAEQVRESIKNDVEVSSVEQVPYSNALINARIGVLPGEGLSREWGVGFINNILVFESVPVTTARVDTDLEDIISIQEWVDEAREMTVDEFIQLYREPRTTEWAKIVNCPAEDGEPAKSIIRAGILAHLVGSLDDTEKNCIIKKTTGKVFSVDNSLSFGIVTGKTFEFNLPIRPDSSRQTKVVYADLVESRPLELVMKHGLRLDDEALGYVRGLYKKLIDETSGEYKTLLNVFRIMFRRYGEGMAIKQLKDFIGRLQDVAENGRPTRIEEMGGYEPWLAWKTA